MPPRFIIVEILIDVKNFKVKVFGPLSWSEDGQKHKVEDKLKDLVKVRHLRIEVFEVGIYNG